MNQKDAQVLIETIKSLVTDVPASTPAKGNGRDVRPLPAPAASSSAPVTEDGRLPADQEKLYQYLKRRLLDDLAVDPVFLHLLALRPEIVLDVERKVINLDRGSLKGRAAFVIAAGFLTGVARAAADIKREMMKTGPDVHVGDLGKALRALRDDGILTDTTGDGSWTLAAGVKITERTLEK